MNRSEKTIFLVVHQGFEARYLLRTDILHLLKERAKTIVILTPNADEDYFRKEFHKNNVVIERFRSDKCEEYLKKTKGPGIFKIIRSFVLNGRFDIQTLDDQYKIYKNEAPKKTFEEKIKTILIHSSIKILRMSKLLRKLFHWVEVKLFSPNLHKDLFEKYRPDLVVTTSLGNIGRGYDFFILREAKRHKVKTVSIILSWDNTTSKGMAAARPNHLVAWTDIMQQELIGYHDFPKKKVSIGGIAHFDIYYRKEKLFSKEDLFHKFDLDLNKKLILFGAKSPTSYPWNAEIVQQIAEAIASGDISIPSQILVRLHPLYFVYKKDKRAHIHLVDRYEAILKKFPFVKLDKPEILSDRLTLDMPESEQIKLASILNHTDVLVNIFSTLNIEGSIMDVPTVNIVYEGEKEKKKRARQDIQMDFNQVHNRRVMGTGALTNCFSPDELVPSINAYLENPTFHREQRQALVEQEAGPFRGNAGETITNIIMSL